jgi:phosphate transport system substrate-binding protein
MAIVSAISILLLTITPVYAAPSLSLGSTASYNLTGSLQASQNCSAIPSIYAGQVCSGLVSLPPANVTLNGAGSTFVSPLLAAIDASFTKTNPSVQVNFQAVGSGTGIIELTNKIVDFAASDAPLTNAQTVGLIGSPLTIPDMIGAVVVAYNLPGNSSGLHLNATVTAEIFQGNITHWNDARIQALNPSLSLPNSPITLVHRLDASGTTFVFSGYLSSSPIWKLGQSKTILWPGSSIGANGNQGVASIVQVTNYSVGYVELDYALSATPPMTYAFLWNPTGSSFIQPTLASTALAVTSISSLPAGNNATAWQSVSLLNSSNPGAYPIVSFSYLMVYQELNVYGPTMTAARASALVNYLSFVVGEGQLQAAPLNYVPLPPKVGTIDQASIRSITYNGQPPAAPIPLPSPPVLPPMPSNVSLGLAGTVGWTVEAISTAQANLDVSHLISLSISPIPGITVTPVTESGSFEQSINLSTRVESPSTTTGIAQSFATTLLSALAGTTLATGGTGSIFQNMLSVQPNSPDYTMWWVNGPLSLGSPVQVLQGWSSVTGSESLNLGSSIGTRSAWIVTSQLSQTFSLNVPNPSNPFSSTTSTASVSLKLLWSYDKSADLMLRNDNAASLTVHSVTPTTIYASTGPVQITVTRDMALNLDLALLLSSTNLSLPKAPSHASSLMDMLSALPWMPIGVAGLAAGAIVGSTVWFTRRSKGSGQTAPAPAPSPTPPTAA